MRTEHKKKTFAMARTGRIASRGVSENNAIVSSWMLIHKLLFAASLLGIDENLFEKMFGNQTKSMKIEATLSVSQRALKSPACLLC